MNPIAIRVEGLGKKYRIGRAEQKHETLAGKLSAFLKSPLSNYRRLRQLIQFDDGDASDVIHALDDVSFEVRPGEVVGVIGRNGAGKSTLLKILARIVEPSRGRAEVYGRLASLLEVGTGFHPDLTGRENIFLNGAILGMKRHEIGAAFTEIVEFSGVDRFIDTPVKRYSSGMRMRLAFSIAAHLRPAILLIDEVLAVGDAAFQQKCLGKMREASNDGRTVLFVSHNMGALAQLCQRGLVLENGRLDYQGSATEAIERYLSRAAMSGATQATIAPDESLAVQINRVTVCDNAGRSTAAFSVGYPVVVEIGYVVRRPTSQINFSLILTCNGSDVLCSFDTDVSDDHGLRQPGKGTYRVELPTRILKAGFFSLTLAVGINRRGIQSLRDVAVFRLEDLSENTSFKGYAESRPGVLRVPIEWTLLPE